MDQREFARKLRRDMTDAERLLWRHLRSGRLQGHKFRRQHPLGPYIVDFVHLPARVIVEADGGQHNGSAGDVARDTWLRAQGYRVLRFWNNDILCNIDGVLEEIWETLTPGPSPAGRERGGTGRDPRSGRPLPACGERDGVRGHPTEDETWHTQHK